MMKQKNIKNFVFRALFTAIAIVSSLAAVFLAAPEPVKITALSEKNSETVTLEKNFRPTSDELLVSSAYNAVLDNDGEYKYLGKGYSGMLKTAKDWNKGAYYLETEESGENANGASYSFGDGFSGLFSVVLRPLHTLYYDGEGTSSPDFGSIKIRFADNNRKSTFTIEFYQKNTKKHLSVLVTDGNGEVVARTEVKGVSLFGKGKYVPAPLYFSFDPTSKNVSVRTDDYMETDATICTVNADGFDANYEVTLSFSDMSDNVTIGDKTYACKGRALVYELCGQVLIGETPDDTAVPMLSAFYKTNKYIAKKNIRIPDGVAYDVLDGKIDDVKIFVEKDGAEIATENGSFYAENGGNYNIKYSVTDKSGKTAVFEKKITVYGEIVKTEFDFEFDLEDKYCENDVIDLPKARVTNSEYGDLAYVVCIKLNGSIKRVVKHPEELKSFRLEESGDYSIFYIVENVFGMSTNKVISFKCEKKPVINTYNLPETLPLNHEIDCETVYAYFGDEETKADLTLTKPDGTKLFNPNGFYTDREGAYLFSYSATIGGQTVKKDVSIVCEFQVTDMFYGANGSTGAGELFVGAANEQGMVLSSVGKTKMRYAGIVDLKKTSEVPVAEFTAMSGAGFADALNIDFVLTDVYDPQIKVTVRFTAHSSLNYISYVSVGVDGVFRGHANEKRFLGDENFKIFENIYGTVARGRFYGSDETFAEMSAFNYDYDEMQINVPNAVDYGGGKKWTVLDLDDERYIGKRQIPNFTTGEVYVDVEFGENNDKRYGVLVKSIAGQLVPPSSFTDETAPELSVISGGEDSIAMPFGVVGKEYEIFKAVATDVVCAFINVSSVVEYLGGSDYEKIAITDGKIVPEKAGAYRIVYSAEDIFGNKAEKVLYFDVYEQRAEPVLCFEDSIVTPEIGDRLYVPEIAIENCSGRVSYKLAIEYNGVPYEIDGSRTVDIFQSGEIRIIVFEIIDYLGLVEGKTLVETIEISVPENIVLGINGVPTSVVSGKTLILPDFTAYDYAFVNNDENHFAVKEIRVNGTLLGADRKYKVTELPGSVLRVGFMGKAKSGSTLETEIVYEIIVRDNQTLNDFFLFDKEKISSTVGVRGIIFSGNGESKVDFADYFVADGFNVKFGAAEGSLLRVQVRLTDYYAENESVLLTFSKNAGKLCMSINGGNAVNVSGSLDGTSFVAMGLKNFDGNLVDILSQEKFAVERFENGAPFGGFTSNRVRISVSFVSDVNGKLELNTLGNQVFNLYSYENGQDITAPAFCFKKQNAHLSVARGSDVKTYVGSAYDTFDGELPVFLTATDPLGNKVAGLDNVPASKAYEFTADMCGRYVISYVCADESGNKAMTDVFVDVPDVEKPNIEIDGERNVKLEAGKEFVVPTAQFSDNYSVELKTKIFLRDASMRYTVVESGGKLKLAAGKYEIIYYAVDEAGNYRIEKIILDVE